MKSFDEIRKELLTTDYQLVANVLGVSVDLVKKVVYGTRTDRKGIQLAFNILLKQREEYEMMVGAIQPTKNGITISEEAPAELREELESMLRVFNVDQY